MNMRAGEGEIDDIYHLVNRRVRTIDELATEELLKGFLELRRTVQERMAIRKQQDMTPRRSINPKRIPAAIEYFFGRGELSKVVDQTNPLAQLTHERRLSALGPGGLNRKRAGFEVRDVHISHYGRICPIETPEGTNIGLISHLSIYAKVDEYGFLVTPYRGVKHRKLTNDVKWLRADEEAAAHLAPADAPTDGEKVTHDRIIARIQGDFSQGSSDQGQYIDIGPKQMVAGGAATRRGELALGRNVVVAFMSWDGYNFEDAIIISEKLVENDTYTSIHIEEFEIEIRETKLGKEEFTRDIPNVSPKALANLDDYGIVRVATFANPGDILAAKVSPKSKSELTPEEKLLHAIFGRAGEDVKNDSLDVPSGVEGVVIETQRFSRRASMTEEERNAFDKEAQEVAKKADKTLADQLPAPVTELCGVRGNP